MTPQVCATVTGPSMRALCKARDQAVDADLLEVRLDTVDHPDVRQALAGRRRPAIVTCRAAWEGGHFTGSEDERERILLAALEAGAEWVDVEWRASFRDRVVKQSPDRAIVSVHDFEGVPGDVDSLVTAMRSTGAAMAKLAVTPGRLAALGPLATKGVRHGHDGRLVFVAMGVAGLLSRVLPLRFGSRWTYAGDAVAPGQVTLDRLVHEFRVRQAGPSTRLFGLVGRPVTHSLSPPMHNAAFTAAGLDAMYVPMEAADFDDFLACADTFGVEGASVTAPFKTDAYDVASPGDDLVATLGAANTLRRAKNGWTARNTDVDGFLAPLDVGTLAGRRAAVLGAGGAARAVVAALVKAGMDVTVHARRPDMGSALAEALHVAAGPWPPEHGAWDLLVNTTPAGTWPRVEESPLSDIRPPAHGIVYDLVYNPAETRLLADARKAGCGTIGGLAMLVAQAERQFAWWTDAPPPDGVMRAAAEAALQERRIRSEPKVLPPST
jgi:3-dehydroquinate dehydratase / shikimate dehydrogenase